MMRIRRGERSRRSRLWILLVLILAFVVGPAGAYYFYTIRKQQNTLKLLRKAEQAAMEDDWDNAAAAYRQYLRREPSDTVVLEAYADVLLAQSKTSPKMTGVAVRTLRRLVGIAPDNAAALGKLTRLYLALREYRDAEGFAESWVNASPGDPEANLALARARYGTGQTDRAAETLVEAIEQNPAEPRFYPLLVIILARDLQKPDEAARWLEHALEIGEGSADVQFAAFEFHVNQGDKQRADQYLKQALALGPLSPDRLVAAAAFYLSSDRLDDAQAILDQAYDLDPKNRAILAVRALFAKKKGDAELLVNTADELVTHAKERDLELLVEAGELYLHARRFDRAEECLARLDSLAVPRAGLEARIAFLKGALALGHGRPYAAIAHLRRASGSKQPSPRSVRLLALAYRQVGEVAAAAETYERLLAIVPDDYAAQLASADLAWLQDRFADARRLAGQLSTRMEPARADLPHLIELACDLRETRRNGQAPGSDEKPLQMMRRLAESPPADLASARWLTRCLVLTGQPQQAVEIVQKLTEDQGLALQLGAELGRLLSSEGLNDAVLTLADDLIQRYPTAPEGHTLRVLGLGSTGRQDQARLHVERSNLPAEHRGMLLETLGGVCLAQQDVDSALDLFRHAADLLPHSISVRQKLARLTSDLGDAVARVEEIRAIEGDEGLRWKYALAAALLRLDPSDDSLLRVRELLEECLSERPRWSAAWLLSGYADEVSGRVWDAAEAYQRAITLQPSLGTETVAIRLVGLFTRLGRFAEAEAVLNSLAASSPDQPRVLWLQTQHRLRQGDVDSALSTAQRLLEVEPDNALWSVITADLHLRAGDAPRAEEIAAGVLDRFPDSAPALWALARALMAQHREPDAERRIREALAAVGGAPHHILLAQFLHATGRTSEAEEVIALAQELAPDDRSVWAASAEFWRARGERARQIASARKVVELQGEDPTQSLAFARLLAASAKREERAEAGEIVRRRLNEDPDDPQALALEGQLAVLQSPPDLAKAVTSLSRALTLGSRSPDVHRLLGLVQFHSSRPRAACDTIDAGLVFAPNDPDLLLASAEVHSTLGENDRAIRDLRQILELSPRLPAALRLLAKVYLNMNQADQAIAFLEARIPPDAWTSDESVILARLYESENDLERAHELLRRASMKDQRSPEAHQELLYFLMRRQEFDKIHSLASERRVRYPNDIESLTVAGEILSARCSDARLRDVGNGWLDFIVQNHPDHAADALLRMAHGAYRRGDFAVAESKLLDAWKHSPVHAQVVNDLAWLYAEDLRRPQEAVELIERFLSMGGIEDAHLLDTHGLALLRLGRLDAARSKFAACLSMAGNTPTQTAATYHTGLLHLKAGQQDEGITYIRTALELEERLGGLTDREHDEARRLLESQSPELADQNPAE